MAVRTDTAKLNWPRWAQGLLIAALVLMIGVRLSMVVDTAAARSGLIGEYGTHGGDLMRVAGAKPGFLEAVGVVPGGPMARAGVREGDFVRPERISDYARRKLPGEQFRFTLDQDGTLSERQLTVEADKWDEASRQQILLNAVGQLVSIVIGCLVLWRGWGNKAAMLLGMALASIGTGGLAPPWASDPIVYGAMWSLMMAASWAIRLGLPFAMLMYEQSLGPLPRWHWRAAIAWLILNAMVAAVVGWNFITLAGFRTEGINQITMLINNLVSFSYLVAGWRTSKAAARNRFALLTFTQVIYQLAWMVMLSNFFRTGDFSDVRGAGWLNYVLALMTGLIAPGLLAYAVLKHKLLDFGFAVNRTLVYGALSVILLASFALLEWAVKHLIPKEWYGGSAYLSAAIAVGLFLLFHRIHHAVEQVIERLFFHKWQLNEAALRRFVRAAAHVEKPGALGANFAAELARFTGGARVAIHARTPEGAYASDAGEPVVADDPALAAMRAEQAAVVPGELGSPIDAALALPMMHQAALAGFVLLGPKPTGEDYRPDEIEVLAWAAHQVGLDLQAIRVRALELSVTSLEARNRNLSEILERAALAKA